MKEGYDTHKGSRQLLLFHPENLKDAQWEGFDALEKMELNTSHLSDSRTAPLVLVIHVRWECQKVFQSPVLMGNAVLIGIDTTRGDDAQGSAGRRHSVLVPPPHQRCPGGRLKQPHSGS